MCKSRKKLKHEREPFCEDLQAILEYISTQEHIILFEDLNACIGNVTLRIKQRFNEKKINTNGGMKATFLNIIS